MIPPLDEAKWTAMPNTGFYWDGGAGWHLAILGHHACWYLFAAALVVAAVLLWLWHVKR